jgi:hypothetical protein
MRGLKAFFWGVLATMVAAVAWASRDRGVLEAMADLLADPWGVVTLVDLYLGFFVFYLWLVYKETSLAARVLWLLAILTLGNIATAAYVLWQLHRLPAGATAADLLLRRPPAR